MAKSDNSIPYGYCQCGCGQLAPIAKKTITNRGIFKGKPHKYVKYHHASLNLPENVNGNFNPRWKGGRNIVSNGYVCIWNPSHHRANKRGYVLEHIVVAEEMLGRQIKDKEIVHHIDGNRSNNSHENIYVFCNTASHLRHHARLKAFQSTGYWHYRKCNFCKKYDDPKNMHTNNSNAHHSICHATYHRELRHSKDSP